MKTEILLRDTVEADLPVFFENQLDPEANYMAAFTSKDPTDREAYITRWTKILGDNPGRIKTILWNDEIAGSVFTYDEEGYTDVSYWLGKAYWGKGIATQALAQLLEEFTVRPLRARAVKDNIGSIRVLQKCGFTIVGEDKGFANGRGMEVEEYVLKLEE